ncbi:MAG: hypothetical protein CMJ16_09035 [Peredibacter sp.]|nr:hypothetical protein [Peredibacter sp.]
MGKFLFLFLGLLSSAVFSNTCYVELVDQYSNYRYDTFTSYYGCRDAQRECNRAKRDRGLYSANCRVQGGYSAPTRPGYGRFTHLLILTDTQLAIQAQARNVGSCVVEKPLYSTCNYYVRVNRTGFPHPTGCASKNVVTHRKCNYHDEQRNAGCFIRQAIVQGKCI